MKQNIIITNIQVKDVRFPTSLSLDGLDAFSRYEYGRVHALCLLYVYN